MPNANDSVSNLSNYRALCTHARRGGRRLPRLRQTSGKIRGLLIRCLIQIRRTPGASRRYAAKRDTGGREKEISGKAQKKNCPSRASKCVNWSKLVISSREPPSSQPRNASRSSPRLRSRAPTSRDLGNIIGLYYNVPGCRTAFREDTRPGPSARVRYKVLPLQVRTGINALIMHYES